MSEKIEIQKKPMQRSQDEQLKEAIQKLEGFVDIKEVDEWEYFFFRQEMEIVYREEFLYKWADILSGMKLSKEMYRFVNDKFDDIEKYCIEKQKKPGEIASVRYARDKIKASYMRNGEGHLKEVLKENGLNVLAFLRSNKKRIIVISIQVVLMTIPLILQYMEQKEQEEEERIKENFQMMIEQDVSGLAAQANSYKLENVAKEAVTVRDGIYLKKWGPQLQSEEVGYREITDIREIGTVDGRSLKDKEYYALRIWGKENSIVSIISFEPEKLGFSEEFRVFYFDGYEYQEIAEQGEENSEQKSFLVEMYDYYSFTITIPQGDENTGVLIIWMNE